MKRRFTEDSWRKEPWFRSLCASLLSCKNEEDIANFLRDIGTLSELQAWSERLEVVRLLSRGLSYRQVAKMTGASTTTVTRVAHFLENGAGGYRKLLRVHRHHRLIAKKQNRGEGQSMQSASMQDAPTQIPMEELPPIPRTGETSPAQTEAPPRQDSPLQKYLGRM